MFNLWCLAEWSEQQKLTEMWKRPPKSSWNAQFWITFNFWWSAKWSEWWKSTKLWKKGPLSHQKMKCSFLDYVQFLTIGWAIQAMKVDQNTEKGPLSHQKMKCSFLDYVQLLMIGKAIQATVNWNAKKAPQVIKKWNACFWITFNFWWSAEWWKLPKMQKKGPLSHQIMKCSFLDYV